MLLPQDIGQLSHIGYHNADCRTFVGSMNDWQVGEAKHEAEN
jgi:hypothetical protein